MFGQGRPATQAIWKLFSEIGLTTQTQISIHADNTGSIANTINGKRHRRDTCYELPQNPVFELRKNYINQDDTELLLCYRLLYILHSASCLLPSSLSCVLFLILRHHLVSSSLHYVTSLSWNEANSLHYPPSKIVSSQYRCTFSQVIEWQEL